MKRKVVFKARGAETSELKEPAEQSVSQSEVPAPPVVKADYAREPLQTETDSRSKDSKFWLIFVVTLCVVCILPLAVFLPAVTAPNAEKTLARVPIGSKLADLDELANGRYDGLSDVTEWIRVSIQPGNTESLESNEHGTFNTKDLGSFRDWKASTKTRNRFTGMIHLVYFSDVIPDGLNPSFFIDYVYVDGVLKKKDLGHLPG